MWKVLARWFQKARMYNQTVLTSEKGFTLLEMLMVLVLVSVISTIAMPSMSHVLNKTKAYSDISSAELFYHAVKMELLMCRDEEKETVGGIISSALVCGEPAELLLDSEPHLNFYPNETFYLNISESGRVSVHVNQQGEAGDEIYPDATGKYEQYAWR